MSGANTLTFQMEKNGVYIVTGNFGFTMTMDYFKMIFCNFLLGNLAPGQEIIIRNMLFEEDARSIQPQRFQARLTRARRYLGEVALRLGSSCLINAMMTHSSCHPKAL